MATKMKRRAKPTLTSDEARSILPRRHRRYRQLNDAAVTLAEKMKPVKKDIRACLGVLPDPVCEAAGVKSQLIEVTNVEKKEARNIEVCRSALSRADFEECCPRAIDLKALEAAAPGLAEKLRAKTATRLEIDLVQEPVAKGA